MRLVDVVPHTPDGASRFGVHFLKDLACPHEWALKWLLPTAEGRGIQPVSRLAGALDKGLAFHKFAEVWYRSRCATGEDNGVPSLEEALAAADKLLLDSTADWGDSEELEAARADVREWGVRYHNQYGPGGAAPEFPMTRVYVDETGPWIERELEVALPVGLRFTCRIDLVATHMGALGAWDHKTVSPSGFYQLLAGLDLDAQPTGNLLALRHALPQLAPQLTFWTANIINKAPAQKPTQKSPPHFARERTHRTSADVDAFQSMVGVLLVRLDEWVGQYGELVESGVEPIHAISHVFPRFGQLSGHCRRYGRACDFASLCGAIGFEGTMLGQFKPRTPHPVTTTEEE